MSNQNPKPKPTCYTCGFDIIFDKNITSQKTGKMIPLDPDTKKPHECQEVKNEPIQGQLDTVTEKQLLSPDTEYVDHTLAKPSEVKLFISDIYADLERDYKEFQVGKKFAWTRAQYQPVDSSGRIIHCIAFYYEEKK